MLKKKSHESISRVVLSKHNKWFESHQAESATASAESVYEMFYFEKAVLTNCSIIEQFEKKSEFQWIKNVIKSL